MISVTLVSQLAFWRTWEGHASVIDFPPLQLVLQDLYVCIQSVLRSGKTLTRSYHLENRQTSLRKL